ncbi:MAG: head GIN domain-containing protein [Salinibacter sp.]
MTSVPSSLLRTVLLMALVLGPLHSALAQDQTREARPVDAFTEIEFETPGTLHLRQGEAHSVEVKGPSKVLDRLVTEVDGEALDVRAEDDSGLFGMFDDSDLDGDEVDIYVTAPTIERVGLAGSGQIEGETRIESESLSLSVAGSGDMNLEVATEQLEIGMAGSGDCMLRGRADTLTTKTAGSGDIKASEMKTRTAEVDVVGSGDAELHVTERLDARILGSGDVQYRGQPEVELSSLGSGTVSAIE